MRVRGFTLLELMVVLAIIGVLTAMGGATVAQIGARNATQNAASDLSALLQQARARAELSGSDVYVLVYPRLAKDGTDTGRGAVFVYEDANGDFLSSTGTCNGAGTLDCGLGAFSPPSNVRPPSTSRDRLVEALYLDDYPKKNVRFGKPAATVYGTPFTAAGAATSATGCSFCSTNGRLKGALVFSGEQQLRFLDGDGAAVAQRMGGLALQALDTPSNVFFFGLVRSTGLVTLVK